MKVISTFLVLCCFAFVAGAQTVKFGNKDDLIKVKAGDNILIKADSAYLVSAIRAQSLNSKLNELDEIKALYSDLSDNRKALLGEVKKAHKLLAKLTAHMEGDSIIVSNNLSSLIGELDASLSEFKDNNQLLKKNNDDLALKISQLKRLIKSLKKETKGLWWNGITDKIIAFATGVGVGAVLVSVL